MTERAWLKLKAGDQLMNKRQRGIILTVVKVLDREAIVLADRSGLETEVPNLRYKEFVQYLPQERMPL